MNENNENFSTDVINSQGLSDSSGNDPLSISSGSESEDIDTNYATGSGNGVSSNNIYDISLDFYNSDALSYSSSESQIDYSETLDDILVCQEQISLSLTMILLFLVLVWTEKKIFISIKKFVHGKERR